MGLTQEQALALLGSSKTTPTVQRQSILPVWRSSRNTKHVTWYDTEMRCANKSGIRSLSCGSPTYIKVLGVPKCQTHTILQLAEMLDPTEKLEGEL